MVGSVHACVCVCVHLLWRLPSAGSVGSQCLEGSQTPSLPFKYPDTDTLPLRTRPIGRDMPYRHRRGGGGCIHYGAVCLLAGESD